jgi:hypothetical protein
MRLGKAEQIVILACLIGLSTMVAYLKTRNEYLIYSLLVPVSMMLYAKKVNNRELKELDDKED